jgi:hypothetical protein
MPNRVVASFNNEAGDHCVDIFLRDDRSFGFEEYRRDHEDLRGWFPLHRYGHLAFANESDALSQARSAVEWMAHRHAFRK